MCVIEINPRNLRRRRIVARGPCIPAPKSVYNPDAFSRHWSFLVVSFTSHVMPHIDMWCQENDYSLGITYRCEALREKWISGGDWLIAATSQSFVGAYFTNSPALSVARNATPTNHQTIPCWLYWSAFCPTRPLRTRRHTTTSPNNFSLGASDAATLAAIHTCTLGVWAAAKSEPHSANC